MADPLAAAHRAGDGQGRRGPGVLALRAAGLARRGRRRPEPDAGDDRRRPARPPPGDRRSTGRRRCSPARPTTRSGPRTSGPPAWRWPPRPTAGSTLVDAWIGRSGRRPRHRRGDAVAGPADRASRRRASTPTGWRRSSSRRRGRPTSHIVVDRSRRAATSAGWPRSPTALVRLAPGRRAGRPTSPRHGRAITLAHARRPADRARRAPTSTRAPRRSGTCSSIRTTARRPTTARSTRWSRPRRRRSTAAAAWAEPDAPAARAVTIRRLLAARRGLVLSGYRPLSAPTEQSIAFARLDDRRCPGARDDRAPGRRSTVRPAPSSCRRARWRHVLLDDEPDARGRARRRRRAGRLPGDRPRPAMTS